MGLCFCLFGCRVSGLGFGLVWCFGLALVVWLFGCGFACVVCGEFAWWFDALLV